MEWTKVDAVIQKAAQKDSAYQQILRYREEYSAAYQRLLQELTEQQREILVSYAYFDVELEHQRTRLAYYIGRSHSAAAPESQK